MKKEDHVKRFVDKSKLELDGKIFDDLQLNSLHSWCQCRFASKRHDLIYILTISTAKYSFMSQLFENSSQFIMTNGDRSDQQASNVMFDTIQHMKKCLSLNDHDNVFEQFLEADNPDRLGRKIIEAIIDVEEINTNVISELIINFWNSGEMYWKSSDPISFSEDQLIFY